MVPRQTGFDRRLHGQRSGRPLSPSLRSHLEHHLAALDLTNAVHCDRENGNGLDPARLFPGSPCCWLEIGFGNGEHLVHHARNNPHVGLIGCEAYMRGVASAVGKIRDAGLANIRIHPGDIRDLLDILPTRSITRTFLMFPDPWPKRRHHKRRFVNREYLDPLARVMAPGAELRIATDSADYVRQTLAMIVIHGKFQWTARSAGDWDSRWNDSTVTRYEEKALGRNARCFYLTFTRKS
ncbi:MAG: tRNA (guanosine(46)-N7)-methyltransferase TrmB [Rhodobacteraceae bacterium]|nr:tRNA (guanosine(46)-N7)-methyltransferase TrmB [Paracoccaceae bacterium]